jgi:hypothetical protein
MKLTQHEWQILATGLSIIVFPLLYTIIRRHYDKRPADWERFYIRLVPTVFYVGSTIFFGLGFLHSHSAPDTFFCLAVAVASGFGTYFFGSEAKEAFEQATRSDDR